MPKVRVGSTYRFEANGSDIFDRRDYTPADGTIVKVVNRFGCPKANTMGHCYVDGIDGTRYGLVSASSLTPFKSPRTRV